jgi:hypothetical protein
MTDTRAAFERWFQDDFLNGMDTAGGWDAERNCYVTHQVHMAWMGWQAAINHERSECAKVCEDYGSSYDNEWNRKLGVANDLKDACEECAAAIRARA